MKRVLFLVLISLLLAGCTAHVSESAPVAVSPDPELPGTPHPISCYIVVRGFEWGPGVNKIILGFDSELDGIAMDEAMSVVTSHYEREITAVYLSDALGNAAKGASSYVSFEFVTNFDCTGSPFEVDMDTELNIWADEYIVTADFTVLKNDTRFAVSFSGDCIDNRYCPEMDRFSVQGSYTGDYVNPLTQKTETLTLNYAAYEPDSLDSWEQNPLIIWLHGLGEGGQDMEKTILGNEVSALTESEIQSHFIAGEQTGAYVLVVQTPTYWMDSGDGRYHRGDLPSRYTEILMDTILAYLETNPDVDTDRIYLTGASNGGYMTLNMIISYPDFFAAGVPCSPAYAYNVFAKDYTGSYRMFFNQYIKTPLVYLTEDKTAILSETPLWFIQAVTDTIVPATDYTIPVYKALLETGADNCWCSMYFDVTGTESSNTFYLGHWAWVYMLNDQVSYVQDRSSILSSTDFFLQGFQPSRSGGTLRASDENGTYDSLFDWLNAQSLK